jgi:hypothetical protein
MIGGTDIILKARDERAAMDMAIRVIRLAWEHAVFEDADTGQTFRSYSDIDLRGRPEIRPDPAVNATMIHLIGRRGELTIGLDDVPGKPILSIVDIIQRSLRTRPELFAGTVREAA